MNYYTMLTKAGAAKLANAIAANIPLTLSRIAVGDGNGAPVVVKESVTALVRECYRGGINSVARDEGNPNWLAAEMVIPTTEGGFTIREIGLFDEAGDLVAYGNFPESYKPVLAEGAAKELVVRMYVETSAAASVTLKIDPSVVLATQQWVNSRPLRAHRAGLYFFGQL